MGQIFRYLGHLMTEKSYLEHELTERVKGAGWGRSRAQLRQQLDTEMPLFQLRRGGGVAMRVTRKSHGSNIKNLLGSRRDLVAAAHSGQNCEQMDFAI